MKRKFIIIFLIIMCVIGLLNSCKLIFRERILLKITDENREYIVSILNEYTDNVDTIIKVGYGRVWSHGYIYVYKPFEKTETLLISEGDFSKGDLEKIIVNNGYKEKYIGMSLGIASIVGIILCIIILKNNKNETF